MLKKILLFALCMVGFAHAQDSQSTENSQRQRWMEMTSDEREAYWGSINEQHRQGINAALDKFNKQIEEREARAAGEKP